MRIVHHLIPAVTGTALAVSAGLAAAQEVNLYSARHYDSDQAIYDAFEEETGIEVRVLQGDSDQLIERIEREGEATPADVLMTVDVGRLWRADEAGVFTPTESETLSERIPSSLRHPDGHWFGLSQRMRVIFYDTEQYDEPPLSSYEELADPRFEGEVCIRSSNNIYNQSLMASIISHHGEDAALEWAEGVVNNMARAPQGGDTDQIRGVGAGECGLAVANHYYYVRLMKSDDEGDRAVAERAGIIFPNQDGRGTHVNVGGAGVVANGPNPENAVRFLEFLASDEAQSLFAAGNNEFPVVDGVEMDPILEEWGEINTDDANIAEFGPLNPVAVRLMDQAGWR
ncbi:Fe(3+) ABC transporter substrate-binding protein [Sediminicurvatus halobius]|uniref:Fe(3+) ABC transporter substrate-binding protein n=1 Tax=Sediminicurvatus halobius TaxID=2182432 RepID=A0A2U2MZL3_9GAMM|nr:Fe(3+) ABC transporter substrate-binding protein [Spiribacter halobius]PWG62425.1 Fe(3+) ABC transporter substrate-binding protein [Spiribacter halobius]UEX79528.1 Fe(3+) ABC transporter substrate-binding protein [Spiribacter halobius]